MALPWDNWIYHTDYKRSQVEELHDKAVGLQGDIAHECTGFNTDLKTYASMAAANATLTVTGNAIQWSDKDYRDFVVALENAEPPLPGTIPQEILSVIGDFTGGTLVGKAIVNIAKILKNGKLTFAEEPMLSKQAIAKVGDTVTESSGENSTTVSEPVELAPLERPVCKEIFGELTYGELLGYGIGVFVSVGIDAILGALNGSKEAAYLDREISKLQDAVGKCQDYLDAVKADHKKLTDSIVDAEITFGRVVNALAHIDATQGSATNVPRFDYAFSPTPENADKFLKAMEAAIKQYGLFINMRNAWSAYVAKRESQEQPVSKAQFVAQYEVTSPLDESEVSAYFAVLEAYSTDMQDAQP